MRTKQALKNMVASLLLEVVLALSGILIPRFFTAVYGSSVNGLVSSISQFITYMSLVEAGIGAAGMVALYGPLDRKDYDDVNEILSAARSFYIRSGWIFVALVAILVGLYPVIVQNEIANASFIRIMILVLSVNGIVDYFFLGKYRVLLQADQKGYVISFAQILGTVVMTIVSVYLIKLEVSALLVKSVAAVIYILRSVIVAVYVKRNYPEVNFHRVRNMQAFAQRWSALLHQIVGMIVNNTDVVLLTLLLQQDALATVSIYSVYNLVGYAISNLLNSISNGIRSSFGQVLAKGQDEVLRKSFSSYEYVMFLMIFFCYVCMAVLLYPFIGLYCADFADGADYLSWTLVALFTAVGLLQSIRLPSLTILIAAGHYKQTQIRAIAEAVINLVVSIALIRPLGIVGVLIGTGVSYLYRSTDIIFYTNKNLISGTLKKTAVRLLRNGITGTVLIIVGINFIPVSVENWISWFGCAVVFAVIAGAVLFGVNLIFEYKEFVECIRRIKEMVSSKLKTIA